VNQLPRWVRWGLMFFFPPVIALAIVGWVLQCRSTAWSCLNVTTLTGSHLFLLGMLLYVFSDYLIPHYLQGQPWGVRVPPLP